MNPENQQLSKSSPKEQTGQFIEYPNLMNSAQISVARKLDIEGSLDTPLFDTLLTTYSEERKEQIINEVGLHFDEALIDLVVAGLIGRSRHRTTILVADTEGMDGYLPWESKLLDRIELLHTSGLLSEVEVQIKRYSIDAVAVESLSQRLHASLPTELSKKHAA